VRFRGDDEEKSVPEGKRALREAFKRLEREVPDRVARTLRSLRHPDARWVRIPIALLAIVGGIFSFLPVLGIWMLPLGLLLLAQDVPFLRKPVARATIWGMGKWAAFRRWLAGQRRSPGKA
jgi:hypothetical protein